MSNAMDAYADEITWLLDHPHFVEKPASIREFLGPGYLDIDKKVREGLYKALEDIFGTEVNGQRIALYEEAMMTGAIGIGKTTFASIALPYMAHWVLCLKDPQDYFELLPGSRIAFMQMSTSEDQALQVIFTDIKARIDHSDWFNNNAQYDKSFTKQIRFPGKDVWILPGDSQENTFEGYNILGGILDEMDSHKITKDKDYADVGFDAITSRIASRFVDAKNNGHKGLIICIGQMKKGNGFAARKYAEMMSNPKAYVMRMTIWESFGWARYLKDNGEHDSFWYDKNRKMIVPSGIVENVDNPDIIEVPSSYRAQFENNPVKALRDLAGIPPISSDMFIGMTHKIDECRVRWIENHTALDDLTGEIPYPVGDNPTQVEFADWFQAEGDPRKRTVHIDLALGGEKGDAVGIAMGYVERVDTFEGELKPYIVIDCLIRLKALPGQSIQYADLRKLLYHLRDDRFFKISTVTFDGFQSTDMMQQLRKRRFKVMPLSVDKQKLPYEDLRDAIYEDRLEFPPYLTYLKKGGDQRVEIAVSELQQLQDTGRKIDHPAEGSKDVADGMAGVVTTLMGDRTYRRGVKSISTSSSSSDSSTSAQPVGSARDWFGQASGLQAPVAPSTNLGMSIPARLQPTRNR